MNPKFSIIVGVYNHRETLPLLVDSLFKQSIKDFEVHFCDDGSDDGTREFLEDLCSQKLDWYYHRQEHKGMRLAKNINQGINASVGEYCVFIMGDSFMEEDYLETLSGWVQPHRIICGIRIQLDKIKGELKGVDMDWRIKKILIPEVPVVSIASPWRTFTGNGMTIPREAFKQYGNWWESVEGYGGEDNEIVARLFHKGYVPWSIPDLRVYHHWHKAQITASGNKSKVANKIIEYYLKS